MPAADIFGKAFRRPCYFTVGKFQNDETMQRLVRASFDLVQIDSSLYIQPVTSPVPRGNKQGTAEVAVFAETGDAFYRAQEEWWEDGRREVFGEHEMGSWMANQQNWKDCFKLGKI